MTRQSISLGIESPQMGPNLSTDGLAGRASSCLKLHLDSLKAQGAGQTKMVTCPGLGLLMMMLRIMTWEQWKVRQARIIGPP